MPPTKHAITSKTNIFNLLWMIALTIPPAGAWAAANIQAAGAVVALGNMFLRHLTSSGVHYLPKG